MKTGQESRREIVEDLFVRILKEERTVLVPVEITCRGNRQGRINVDYSYEIVESNIVKENKGLHAATGDTFIECLFNSCLSENEKQYVSLKNIKLHTIRAKRLPSRQFEVEVSVKVKKYGVYDFRDVSDSVICSGFRCVLMVFQYYINCEKTFRVLKMVSEDAKRRRRPDTLSKCEYDMSILTEINSYTMI